MTSRVADMPHLAAITLFPLKSGSGQSVSQARVLPTGALEHDRQFALCDGNGRFWNGKRSPAFHHWRTWLSWDRRVLTLWEEGRESAWHVERDRADLEFWFAQRLGGEVHLQEDTERGFPDDLLAPGPTVISTETLETVARWFPTLTVDDVRRRFRANLEIEGVEAFWEDRLYGEEGEVRPFRIGSVIWGGVNPCQRCVVPARDPASGELLTGFQQSFSARRALTLPPWAPRSRFDHFYRLAINTRLLRGAGLSIKVGDPVVWGDSLTS